MSRQPPHGPGRGVSTRLDHLVPGASLLAPSAVSRRRVCPAAPALLGSKRGSHRRVSRTSSRRYRRTFWRPGRGLRPRGCQCPVRPQIELHVVVGDGAAHGGEELCVDQGHPGHGHSGARHVAGGIEHPAGVLVAAVCLVEDLEKVAQRAPAVHRGDQRGRARRCARRAGTSRADHAPAEGRRARR